MYLYEFEGEEDLVNTILVAADRLEQMRKDGKLKQNWSVQKLLDYLNQYVYKSENTDYTFDKDDLISMIQKDPLKKTISNIQGNEVVFRGNKGKETEMPRPEKSKEVVDKMAKKAMR